MLKILSFGGGGASKGIIKSAFSIAEAMIVMLIVSVALAAAAPMMSRQAKPHIDSGALIPKGAIMFFDSSVATCPDGWKLVDEKYNGRYFRAAGEFDIYDKDGTLVETPVNSAGTLYDDAIRNITGGHSMGSKNPASKYETKGAFDVRPHQLKGGRVGDNENASRVDVWFDASLVVPIANENRPRSIAMLTCVKE